MHKFDRLTVALAAAAILAGVLAFFIIGKSVPETSKAYNIDINRIEQELRSGREVLADDYDYVTEIRRFSGDSELFAEEGRYVVREINGSLYRIDFTEAAEGGSWRPLICTELIIALVFAAALAILLHIRRNIIKPFIRMSELPYELAKGNITAPVNENKSRYFGKFIWGMDMLRQELESSRKSDIERSRNEKTLLLTLSHDIKTPLSAVKLYSEAIEKGLYSDISRCRKAAGSISEKVDEIEKYVREITSGSAESAVEREICIGEVYQSEVLKVVGRSFEPRLAGCGTELEIGEASDCLLSADIDRLVEVLQNILDNALKYGSGSTIKISFSDEENCRLITVSNSGCTLSENELPYIFNSFWRGSNSGGREGSGLGLYICRSLMNDMQGEVFAQISGDIMSVTIVCPKAG